jgi:hypothetical protein
VERLIARLAAADGRVTRRADLLKLVASPAALSGEGPQDDIAIAVVGR